MSNANGATAPPIETPEDAKATPTWLSRMEIGIRAELDQLEIKRAAIRDQLDAIDRERARYRRVLKAMDPETPLPGNRKPTRRFTQTGKRISVEAAQWMAELINRVDKEEFSVLDLFEADGKSDKSQAGHYYEMVNRLRDLEYLGKARKDRKTKRQLWRKMPDADEVLERLIHG